MGAMRKVLAGLALALASSASAQIVDPPELAPGPETDDCVEAVHAVAVPAAPAPAAEGCLSELAALASYEEVADARGVVTGVRLRGPLAGVEVRHRGGSERNDVMDCRLALALARWAPALRDAGVARLSHLSIYRPGAIVARSGRVSGHAKGLAIDLGAVILEDGEAIDVLNGWEARAHGADPCAAFEESERSARLRAVVCAAVAARIFQVVLTPHHDRAHQNHVHLEVVPGVEWQVVR